jgi:hypothetical protein
MRDSDKLRDRAARLLALALKAREDDKLLLSEEITKLAIEASDQADEMDRREVQISAPGAPPRASPARAATAAAATFV